MKKIQLSRKELVALYNNMSAYVSKVGKKSDALAWICDSIITYDLNEEIIETHTKKVVKKEKELQRLVRKITNKHAKLYTEGDKKGTFVLDEKGGFLYTLEGQQLINDETDVVYDKYEEEIISFMKEKIDFFIDEADSIPEKLPIEFKNALQLLIPEMEQCKQ